VLESEGILTPPDILKIAKVDDRRLKNLHNDFSDDPEMYGAIWANQEDKTEDINDLVKGRLMLMVNQLAGLSLKNGSTADVAKKMLSGLQGRKGGSPLNG
jgi:hypothetical protein